MYSVEASNATRNSVAWLGSTPSLGSRCTKSLTRGAVFQMSSDKVELPVEAETGTASTRAAVSAAHPAEGARRAAIIKEARINGCLDERYGGAVGAFYAYRHGHACGPHRRSNLANYRLPVQAG